MAGQYAHGRERTRIQFANPNFPKIVISALANAELPPEQLGCSHTQGDIHGKPMPHEEVLKQLGEDKGIATAKGHRASRSPRRRILRSANLEVDGGGRKGVIRNISGTGAMIAGIGEIEGGTNPPKSRKPPCCARRPASRASPQARAG